MPIDEITPIRKQYLDIKRQYPHAIVFFRLGDFYETFDQDAEITSRELDIVLTSRNVAKGARVPMAGIPYHAVENYLSRLIDKGYHVAICEQVGEQPVKGLVPRQVSLRYQGFDAAGQPIDRSVSGFHARVVQHEVDHLHGVLYPMRIRDLRYFGFTDTLFPGQNLQDD